MSPSRCGRTAESSRRTCSSRAGRRWRGSPRRSSSAPRSRSRCTSRRPSTARCGRSWSARRRCRSRSIAPLIVFALGFGFAPKVLIVALICFFPIVINVADGLRESDPDARKLLRSLDATRWQRLRFLDAPSALPASFTGMRVAASVAVIGAVFAEWAGSESGLGHLVITANGQLATARAFAATVLLIGMAIALYAAFHGARAALRLVGAEGERMRRLAILAALVALAGCGEKAEPTGTGPPRQEPFTVMLDYFPNADHAGHLRGPGGRPVREGRARRQAPAAAGPVRAAEAARGRPRRRRDLLRARAAARARQRRREHRRRRRAGADAADVADLAAQGRRSVAPPTSPASASAPPASRTRARTCSRS